MAVLAPGEGLLCSLSPATREGHVRGSPAPTHGCGNRGQSVPSEPHCEVQSQDVKPAVLAAPGWLSHMGWRTFWKRPDGTILGLEGRTVRVTSGAERDTCVFFKGTKTSHRAADRHGFAWKTRLLPGALLT